MGGREGEKEGGRGKEGGMRMKETSRKRVDHMIHV